MLLNTVHLLVNDNVNLYTLFGLSLQKVVQTPFREEGWGAAKV